MRAETPLTGQSNFNRGARSTGQVKVSGINGGFQFSLQIFLGQKQQLESSWLQRIFLPINLGGGNDTAISQENIITSGRVDALLRRALKFYEV